MRPPLRLQEKAISSDCSHPSQYTRAVSCANMPQLRLRRALSRRLLVDGLDDLIP